MKEFVPKKYTVIPDKRFDSKFPRLSGEYGAYDFYTEKGKIVKEKIYVPKRALKNKEEMRTTLIHENFHRTERHLSKEDYGKISRLNKARLLSEFYEKANGKKMGMSKTKYIRTRKNVSNHEILAEYSANFSKSINKPKNRIEGILNKIWYKGKCC